MAAGDYSFVDLNREFAYRHSERLAELASDIPQVTYTPGDILTEQKGSRVFHAKWIHGLAVVDAVMPIGFVAGYEREAERSPQYPVDTLYISELAIDRNYRRRGIARELMHLFFEKNDALGMQELAGPTTYSLQTNSAAWNQHVIDFYKSFGFVQRATKQYPDRTDVVMGLTPK